MAKSIARGAPSASTAADNDMFTIHTRIFVQATAIKANTQGVLPVFTLKT
jgi:hypothetical protein